MKNVNKVSVVLSLPNGAHFYNNINLIVYKKLIEFIYKMNCLSPRETCFSCPLSSTCRYYHYTGENFKYYPAILISNDIFVKRIYQSKECISFDFYLVGDAVYLFQYIKVFFEDYLHQKIGGSLFYVKDIYTDPLEEQMISIKHLKINTIIINENFIDLYNDTVLYYNRKYNTEFQLMESCSYRISNLKHIHLNSLELKTKRINMSGVIYTVSFSEDVQISTLIQKIGVGYYNMIGGGCFEN